MAIMTPNQMNELVGKTEDLPTVALVILNTLKELGFEQVTGVYNGSGDSPDSVDINAQVLVETKIVPVEGGQPGDHTKVDVWQALADEAKLAVLASYNEALSEFVFKCSYDHWGGWYNNEGGYGTGTFHVTGDTPCFTIDHYAYVQSESFEGDHTYSAAGLDDHGVDAIDEDKSDDDGEGDDEADAC